MFGHVNGRSQLSDGFQNPNVRRKLGKAVLVMVAGSSACSNTKGSYKVTKLRFDDDRPQLYHLYQVERCLESPDSHFYDSRQRSLESDEKQYYHDRSDLHVLNTYVKGHAH